MIERIIAFAEWVLMHPLDAADISLMLLSLVVVFLCKYPSYRDATVGTLLIVSWIYQIYETANSYRVSAPSDVLFDALFFLIVLSAGGNIMSVVVIANLKAKIKAFKNSLRRGNANQ